jgi:integrase
LRPFETPDEVMPPVAVSDVLEYYEAHHVPNVVSAASRKRRVIYRETIERFALGKVQAEAVRLNDLEQFKLERKVSVGSIAKDFRHLKAAMLFAKARGRIVKHVFETLGRDRRRELMPSWRPEETAGRVIPESELTRILGSMRPTARRIVQFLAATGLRKIEACVLDWREHRRDLPYPAFCPITQKGSRPRLIPFEAVETILGPRQTKGLVFSELGGTAEEIYRRLTACWRYAVKAAKVPHALLHDLRHTFGSVLRRETSKEDTASAMGISAAIASTYMDHESADLTRRAFAKLGTNAAHSLGATVSESN